METETLTFDFGTTPEEVIRERFAAKDTKKFFAPRFSGANGGAISFTDPDDLLTVLDDLAYCALNVEKTWRGSRLPDGRPDGNGHPSAKLRIQILAALGVTES